MEKEQEELQMLSEGKIVDSIQAIETPLETSTGLLSEKSAEEQWSYAGFWMRFWAYLVDLIIVASISRLLAKPVLALLGLSLEKLSFFAPIHIADNIVFFGYFILMAKFAGATLGKMIFGLRIIPLKSERLDWGTVIFREGVGRFISTASAGLPYLVVAFMPNKQGVHDIFADTTVVLEKRNK